MKKNKNKRRPLRRSCLPSGVGCSRSPRRFWARRRLGSSLWRLHGVRRSPRLQKRLPHEINLAVRSSRSPRPGAGRAPCTHRTAGGTLLRPSSTCALRSDLALPPQWPITGSSWGASASSGFWGFTASRMTTQRTTAAVRAPRSLPSQAGCPRCEPQARQASHRSVSRVCAARFRGLHPEADHHRSWRIPFPPASELD